MKLDDATASCPVVAILRGVTPDAVEAIAEALFAAGVRAVEVPLNSPEPLESVRRLAAGFGARMAIGAGTVLRALEAEQVAATGAGFIVAPNTNVAVIRRACALGLAPVPGFATASEALSATTAGARRLKLFPAATYGPGHMRQLRAVLPADTEVWAVGGIGGKDLADWWAAGARAFGVGSELYRPGQGAAETHDKAAALVEAAKDLAR
ncbi:MAG TPA: 2-dehydro-3-deoxy-6-phosphogalactonate aldolase [Caulobacteraceae bacterium]|jgi:2-dehydro-3-deoxyphosphogalactonate aldolase